MGDTPPGRLVVDGDYPTNTNGPRSNSARRASASPFEESERSNGFQGSSHLPGSQGNFPQGQPFPSQHGSQSYQEHFNMSSLGSALPDTSYLNYNNSSPQRYPPGPSPSAHLYQIPNMHQPGALASMNPPATNLPYNVQYQTPFQGIYVPGQNQPTANQQAGLNIGNQFYQGQAFMGHPPVAPYFIQAGQYGAQSQMYSAHPQMGQYGSRGSFAGDNRSLPQQRTGELQVGTSIDGLQRRSSSIGKLEQLLRF